MCYLRIDFFFADIHFQFAWEWFLGRWFFFCMQLGFIYSLSSIVVSKRSHNHKNIRANVKWFLLEAVKRQLRYFLHLFSSIPNFFVCICDSWMADSEWRTADFEWKICMCMKCIVNTVSLNAVWVKLFEWKI